MLYVDLETDSGPFSFRYTITTPTSCPATKITPGIPCILFLHSGYVGQEVFQFQFADHNLRQFNLFAIDMRGYGETKGTITGQYTPKESAMDVDQIMEKLEIPPCHIFGLSNGCLVALELTIRNPSRVLSLTLCSLPPMTDPEIVTSGRQEVYDYWVLMNKLESENPDQQLTHEAMATEVMTGTHQLLYNHSRDEEVMGVARYGLAIAKHNWAGSPEKIKQAYKTSVEWFSKRRIIPIEELKTIKVPVAIIHCAEDVAYTIELADEWEERLSKEAGVSQVSLHEVPGTHYGCVTNPKEVNAVLYDTVVSCHPELNMPPYHPRVSKMWTPFTQSLIDLVGYSPHNSDSEPE